MMTKVVYAIWLGKSNLPKFEQSRCLPTWLKVLPDWEFVWYSDNPRFVPPFGISRSIPDEVKNHKYYKAAIDAGKYAYASDYLRVWLLYNYGGVYLDTDMEMVKSFNDLLESPGYIIGTEVIRDQLMNSVLGVNKGNKFIKDILDSYDGEIPTPIDSWAGPQRLTRIYLLNNYKFEVKPYEWYVGMNYFSGLINKTENTYCIHHYTSSWLTKRNKLKKSVMRFINRTIGYKKGKRIQKSMHDLIDTICNLLGVD